MSVADANRFIAALNLIGEGAVLLARAIEDEAWGLIEDHAGMSGTRPIPAIELAQPPLNIKASRSETTRDETTDQTPAPATVSEPEREPVVVSLAQVRGVLAGLSSQGLTEQVRELIVATGADKLSAVDPAKYGWLLAQAKELSDGTK